MTATTARRRGRGQALVETALVLPFLVMLGFGSIAVARVVQVRLGVEAVAREAARAAALAPMPINVGGADRENAGHAGEAAGRKTAEGYGLRGIKVHVDPDEWGPGGWVAADAAYTVTFNVPVMDEMLKHVQVRAFHLERVDEFRSRTIP